MNSPADILDQAASGLRDLLSAGAVALLPDADKMQLLRALGEVQRATEALIVETVASVDERRAGSGTVTFCSQFGCGSVGELLERALRTDAAGAGRVVKAAKLMRRDTEITTGAPLPARWPQLRGALLDGVIGVAGLLAATWPIERAGSRIGTADRLRADADLAGFARGCPRADADADAADTAPPATPEDLRLLAQAIAAYLDADGAAPTEERAMNARGVVLGRAKDGVIPIRGTLLPEVAAQLQRIWDAYLNPKVDGPPLPGVRFAPSSREDQGRDDQRRDDEAFDDGTLPSDNPGGMVDTRSRSQKQHDALAAALGIAARHDEMPRLGGAAPTVVVSVTAEDYATGRGWARVEGVEGVDALVSVATARHTACGGTVQRVLFDPEGRIIGIGATERIFTVHQRRAIALRDRECLIPGCHVPASWCEIHHVQEYARGGPTSTDNGIALCWHHHRTLETSGWEIRMHNGAPEVRGPAWWDPLRRWRAPRPRVHMPLQA